MESKTKQLEKTDPAASPKTKPPPPVDEPARPPGERTTAEGGFIPWPIPDPPEGKTAGSRFYRRYGKRIFDLAVTIPGFLILLPIFILLSVLIRIDSAGSVLYASQRVGKGGRLFRFFKFRSMVSGADRYLDHLRQYNEVDGPVFKMADDPRITRMGRFLRRSSLDELPQLINVLTGDMSLVGPRPPIMEEVGEYAPWQRARLSVRPGITCLWQISGRSRLGFDEWMKLDLEYIENTSFWLDLKILLRTIPAVLSREGAY